MKILHVFDHTLPLHSGYTFRSAAILREQRKLGWDTHHLSGPKQINCSVTEEDADGLHFYRTPQPTGLLAKLPGADPFAVMGAIESRLLELATTLRPDVIHAHSPVLDAVPAIRVGRKLGIPVVYEIRAFWEDAAVDHGSTREGSLRYKLTRALETWAVKNVDAVTVICDGLRQDLAARGIAPDKITVIPNAVDIDKFAVGGRPDPELKMKLGLGTSRVLGFIGSFYAYEGLDLLLDALPVILKQMPDVKVLLVGGGPQEAALKKQVMALDLKERVIFTGRVPHGDVNRYYDLIDVLVYARHPMRLTELVTPLKPLEAMAQERLMVASDVGGHKELIEDGKTGVLFRAGEADDLAAKVVDLLKNEAGWAAMKRNGRAFVESERNWTASVARYRGVYGRLIGGARLG
ncbi:MAG TPA: glycosyltransferase, exosortase A system-associated [Thiobacillus sp.]|nr:MAG: glycosyltransferase, exosortase A system-associated [Hydrogenophilales bacterium 28-61-11]OYZ58922.1 MAG: glycosyltransferase, exosortase A system-associated [Hydrogenophilales bacterium 16-61-112]HQT30387.1 glycosyltransferase, exosortase A system-associated [Thiobacillus sp.]HQT69001.1 glycosyltransferase, exosortase A system-associated [Thiobacillus sp.]